MAVLINFKICDNAKECDGIAICPTGALFWDQIKESVGINNSKCINCGKCEDACKVDAIRVAKTPEEYDLIKKEFDEDPRSRSDLFVDRYGAQPVLPAFHITEDKFNLEVLESNNMTLAEIFNEESIHCLRFSIPIRDLVKEYDIKFRKVQVTSTSIQEKYGINELPALLFFNDGKLIGKIEGYYESKELNKIRCKIERILKKGE